ncbi:hypothetical protein T4D_12209 [Trichinella pseudospiralis]|uniref:Uncharacterized protein n=1 Tax=Trichinella pseudospiralis TaxID=6337 RepID=A0A0V1F790_TRIPS|nr:hypothetical protein T4D_12209 [Trichinella pseudospiralis]
MFISGQSSNISHKHKRAKQRSNTTNVSPHITSTGNYAHSLSGANFYTSLRLLFSLTLNLIGKRVNGTRLTAIRHYWTLFIGEFQIYK